VKPECGGGLLLLRHVTPLARRYVVYFCSGAYTQPVPFFESFDGPFENGIIPHVIPNESIDATMIHEVAQVRVNAGVEDRISFRIMPTAIFCGE
jgi:hypothetical protein